MVNDRLNDDPCGEAMGHMTVRARRDGWQVIVYAGLDPLTGKQRQLTRQVNDSLRAAKQVEAELRAEAAYSAALEPEPQPVMKTARNS